jgi:GalNAc-alpha-(1->4)-GalNAc-alpha-(1->3)-diNAcBac-PP-undecaprenol alpha-1,4-N-acetyl-D-galactosaminyltransferase
LKIAFLIGMLGAGGAERVMTLLCNSLQASGHAVSLWTFDAAGRDFYALDPRVRRVGFGLLAPTAGLESLSANLRKIRRLRHELRSERPDVLVSFITQANVLALLAAIGLGTPVVISERIDARVHRDPLPWRILRSCVYRRAACLVVQTNALRNWGSAMVGEHRVTTIPNPVVPSARLAASQRASQQSGFNIVAMGRLVQHKGFDLLLEAFAAVATRFADASLVIYGEGPERAALQAQARRLGLGERVALPGLVQNSAEALAAASLFVLSSRYEGFPNVLVEAMSLARPVVAFDCPSGPAEIIRHEIDGLLVPAGNVQALAAAMKRVLSDAELRQRMAARAVEVNERFSQERALAQWLRVLEGTVGHG